MNVSLSRLGPNPRGLTRSLGVPMLPQLETVHRLSSLEKAVVDMRSEMRRFGSNTEKLLCPGDRLLARIDTREGPSEAPEGRPVRRGARRQATESLEGRLGARATTCFEGYHVCGPAHRHRGCSVGSGRGSGSSMEL